MGAFTDFIFLALFLHSSEKLCVTSLRFICECSKGTAEHSDHLTTTSPKVNLPFFFPLKCKHKKHVTSKH